MKKIKYRIVIFLSAFVWCTSCTKKADTAKADYTFVPDNAVTLTQSGLSAQKQVISLSMNDTALVSPAASVVTDGKNFYVYTKGSSYPLLAFDEHGSFRNQIGRSGGGAGEYVVINDVAYNRSKGMIELLSNTTLLRYTSEGKFAGNDESPYPSFSFAVDDGGYYWFYVSNTERTDNYKIVRFNEKLTDEKRFMPQASEALPMYESNFKSGRYLTFSESLSHQVYCMEHGTIAHSYSLAFPGYEFPAGLQDADIMGAMKLLKENNHAVIRSYQESDKYIFLYLLLNKAQQSGREFTLPDAYYWIIDKKQGKEKVVKLDVNVGGDSYLFNPQFMYTDNLLCCLGYILETPGANVEFTDENTNPSLVFLDLDKLF